MAVTARCSFLDTVFAEINAHPEISATKYSDFNNPSKGLKKNFIKRNFIDKKFHRKKEKKKNFVEKILEKNFIDKKFIQTIIYI